MEAKQLGLWQVRSENCPFKELLDEGDNNCFSFGNPKDGYEVIAEDIPLFANWLADIRNVGFGDITAKHTPKIQIPAFIPAIRRGSQKILSGNDIPFVAVALRDIISPKELIMPTDMRVRLGVAPETKVILLCYGKDQLIEKLWGRRKDIFKKIAGLGFDLVTAVNYSVWMNHPHAERLINLKRSLITFEEMQGFGIPVIPHIYWSGKKDLERWSEWLKTNRAVDKAAINLQTEREPGARIWSQTLDDLRFFISSLDNPPHLLITGPSTIQRIQQLKDILPSFSLTNGSCTRKATSGFLVKEAYGQICYQYANGIEKNEILRKNIEFYKRVMQDKHIDTKKGVNFQNPFEANYSFLTLQQTHADVRQ